MTLTVITPPSDLPVTLDAARQHLRIGHDGEDELVARLIAAATHRLEMAAGLALVARTLRRTLTCWPQALAGRGWQLRPGPVGALGAVRLVAADEAVQPLDERFQIVAGRLSLRPWNLLPVIAPGGHVTIDFEVGFGARDAVPADLAHGVLLLVADGYQRGRLVDGAEAGLPEAVEQILSHRREIRL